MSSTWLTELEMQESGFMNQYQMNKPYPRMMDDFSVDSFSSESYTENLSFIDQSFQTGKDVEEPADIKQTSSYKMANSINKKSTPTEKPKPELVFDPSNTFTISFGDKKPKDEIVSFSDTYGFIEAGTKKVSTTIRNPIQVQDHVLAERKRREKLAQRFLSLSSVLPNLKKMDKATVLENAAKYIQQLQHRVKELEGLSVISAKRARLSGNDDDGSSSSDENIEESSSPCIPEIEVRIVGCNLLVEIYSRKNSVSLMKVLSEMQKLGLSVISSSTLPFADATLLITIVTRKNDGLDMSSTDLVKNLQQAI